jgi:hypothetical protein
MGKPSILPIKLAAFSISVLLSFSSYAAETPVCAIAHSPTGFDHRAVSLIGKVTSLRQTTSQRGNDYSTFKLSDTGGCEVLVFTWGQPAIHDDEQVRVDGDFEIEPHVGRYTFHNEIIAKSVTSRPN